MQLQRLTLTNFKNIPEAHLELSGKVNCLVGNNGMGKSNLLDAIYTLSFCKSFTGVADRLLITRGETFAMLKADYLRKGIDENLLLALGGRRKTLKRGGKEYGRLSAHIGSFPLVMIAPRDIDLIRESGEERRRWMDMVISQTSPLYLDALIRYNSALEQRNRMLRDGIVDATLYEVVEDIMAASADTIQTERAAWTLRLSSLFSRYYEAIAGPGETVSLTFRSHLSDGQSLRAHLDSARRHDEIVKHTSVGPHRDDIEMLIDEMPVRRTGSEGQCKTFTIALRLAQYDFLSRATGMKPLLLLDDIFDKLDARRVERIMELVASDEFGQIFITDTNRKHLDEIIARTGGEDFCIWRVDSGRFIKADKDPEA